MPEGRYVFTKCIPDGPIDIANITPGDVVNRAWSFRVNGEFNLESALDNGAFDSRHIARGYDGLLLHGPREMAQVNTWQAQYNPTVTDYQAAGFRQTWGIPMSFTLTLTFTETVFNDALLNILSASIPRSPFEQLALPDPEFTFTGKIRQRVS